MESSRCLHAQPASRAKKSCGSWRDERAEKVIKKVHKLNAAKLGDLLFQLGTTHDKLGD